MCMKTIEAEIQSAMEDSSTSEDGIEITQSSGSVQSIKGRAKAATVTKAEVHQLENMDTSESPGGTLTTRF